MPQIAGDSITIQQRPAAAQAMRDQALRSVLQVLGKIISSSHMNTRESCRKGLHPASASC